MTKKIDIKKNEDLEVVADAQNMDVGAISPLHKEFDTHKEAVDYLIKVKKVISGVYLEVSKNKYVVTCNTFSKRNSDRIQKFLNSAEFR